MVPENNVFFWRTIETASLKLNNLKLYNEFASKEFLYNVIFLVKYILDTRSTKAFYESEAKAKGNK